MTFSEIDWEELLYAIDYKLCTPFIGAEACFPWLPSGKDVAKQWAEKYDYPLSDSTQLSRVAQFIAIDRGNYMYPKKLIGREISKIKFPNKYPHDNNTTF